MNLAPIYKSSCVVFHNSPILATPKGEKVAQKVWSDIFAIVVNIGRREGAIPETIDSTIDTNLCHEPHVDPCVDQGGLMLAKKQHHADIILQPDTFSA